MIDLHTHTLLSDGALLPSELVQRAAHAGYRAIALTDHADASNIEDLLSKLLRFCQKFERGGDIEVIAGVELTHIPPAQIGALVTEARSLGAKIVVCHGETTAEPVLKGTNLAAIEGGSDILSHPGLISEEECRLAAKRGVLLEITSRRGHSLTNGHVAMMTRRFEVGLVINSDSHAPSDLLSKEDATRVGLGAGLNEDEIRRSFDNSEALLKKLNR